ncbi:MAG TPA: sterol desaturase family protein [Acidimicrobiales bacterium]|nr:sterol desaturase family protein [Acidimicrobiales bacterium]
MIWTVAAALVSMEAVSYLAHRFVMHGPGMGLHRSHHVRTGSRFEANDLFPVTFAAVTILAMTAGTTLPSLHALFTVGVGVTLYGAAYAFVHDLYIHRRLGSWLPELAPLERLKVAHEIHHRFGGEPYGMLFPVVPRRLRERAATVSLRHVGTEARFEKTS